MTVGGQIPTLLYPLVESIGLPAWLTSFINGTIVTALGWVFSMAGFVFGINLVFGLLEEVGYMARVSYVFDNTMNKLGLQGKSIMPMLVSFGCTIGGAAGTRVIDSYAQRILTIALAWAVPLRRDLCRDPGARLLDLRRHGRDWSHAADLCHYVFTYNDHRQNLRAQAQPGGGSHRTDHGAAALS